MSSTFKDCVCYNCEVADKYKKGDDPGAFIDCWCESAPMLLNDCSYCDKRWGRPIPLDPTGYGYDKEDDFIEGWRADSPPQRDEPFLTQLPELVDIEYNPKGVGICY